MRVALGRIHRGDDDVILPGMLFLLGDGGDAEFLIQFAHPLQHERSGDENKRRGGRARGPYILSEESGFDRFAEPDFIGENGAAAHFMQHFARCAI